MKTILFRLAGLAILLGVSGCGLFTSEAENAMRDLIAGSKDLQGTLHTVHDPASAKAAIEGLDQKYARLAEDFKKLIKHKDDKMLKSTVEELTGQMAECNVQLKAEIDRLEAVKGLPVEFWKVVQTKGMEMVTTALELAAVERPDIAREAIGSLRQMQDLWAEHGYEKVVQLEFQNLPAELSQEAFKRMRKAAPNAKMIEVAFEDIRGMAVGPVDDYQALLASIDFGTVTFEDEGQRSIKVAVDHGKLVAQSNPNFEESQLRRQEMDAEQEKRRKDWEARTAEHEAAAAKKRAEWEKKERGPDRGDPNYFEIMAERMETGDHFRKEKAIDALLAATPSEVSSPETRKKIARNFKRLAENGTVFDKQKAVKGLVIWGGKYSAPILLKMLDDSHGTHQKEVIQALGDLKDPQAAPALAARLGNFFTHESAFSAIKQIGAGAEDALIDVGPSNDAKVCMAAISLLGDVGTEKSLRFLREAQTSRNPDVRNAAKAAVRKITARKNAAKTAKPPK